MIPNMNIPAQPWTNASAPARILAIRLQAMGDLVITLPYLQHLRKTLPPSTRLDLLTREETAPIPSNIHLFDHVYAIRGGRNFKKQLLYTFLLLPRLVAQRYEMVLDLQNNTLSRIVRKTIHPTAWSEFDRFSPVAAGERTRLTIEAAGLGPVTIHPNFRLKQPDKGLAILQNIGYNGTDPLVVLNPAGFFITRNWAIANYIAFARLWLEKYPTTKFLVLGTSLIAEKTALLKKGLDQHLYDLVGQTSPLEAFAVLQHASLVLSEDSGLMHMAWTSGIPTMVLFGSTRSDWSRPLGPHSQFLDSSDLPCGNCMQATCKYEDVHCLSRFSPRTVFEHSLKLYQQA